jgi:hypothetical protein
MKVLVKKHENSLNTIKAQFDELKQTLDSVRKVSSSVAPQQQYEDMRKFDSIITHMKERWERACGLYGVRRSNLKKCLYTYHEHIKAINNEKQGINGAGHATNGVAPSYNPTTAVASSEDRNRTSQLQQQTVNGSETTNGLREEHAVKVNGQEPKIAVIYSFRINKIFF